MPHTNQNPQEAPNFPGVRPNIDFDKPFTAKKAATNHLPIEPIMSQTTTQLQDLKTTAEFFDALGISSSDTVCIRLIYEDTRRRKKVTQPACYEVQGTLDSLWSEVVRRNSEGYGVFTPINASGTPNGKTTEDSDIQRVRALFTDYDGTADSTPVYEVEPTFKVSTSEGKEHSYYVVNDCPVSDFKKHQSALASHYGTDPSIVNPSRVMRLAGTLNMKQKDGTAPFIVKLIMGSGATYTTSQVLAPTRTRKTDVVGQNPSTGIHPDLMEVVAPIVNSTEGSINSVVFKVACEIGRQLDFTRDVKLDAIKYALVMRGRAEDPHHLATAEQGLNKGELDAIKKANGNTIVFYKELIERTCKGHLYREAYGLEVFFNGEKVSALKNLYVKLAEVTGVVIPKELATDIVDELLSKDEYQRNHLQDCFERYQATYPKEEGLKALYKASDHLGLTDPLSRVLFEKFLLAIVMRTMHPGYKHDTIFMLVGDQGLGKTQLLETLVPGYVDNINLDSDKDTVLKMAKVAIAVMDEVGYLLGKNDMNRVKSFASSRKESIRKPYGSSVEEFDRHCVIAATSNNTDVWNDPSGTRRLNPVMPTFIDIPWFRDTMPVVIAGAMHIRQEAVIDTGLDAMNLPSSLYLTWLSPQEQKECNERNKNFETDSPCEEYVLKALVGLGTDFSTKDLISKLSEQGLEVKPNGRDFAPIKAVLERHKYVNKPLRVNGSQVRRWTKPEPTTPEPVVFLSNDYVTVEGKSGVHIVSVEYQPDGTEQLTVAPIDAKGRPTEGAINITEDKLTSVKWEEGNAVRGLDVEAGTMSIPTIEASTVPNRYAKK